MTITLYGRGAHGSMPQAGIDPVLLAASIVVRLQCIVAREVAPGGTAVVTVGSIQAGDKSSIMPDTGTLKLNVRTYSESVRATVLSAIERTIRAECVASRCPRDSEFELYDRYPLTDDDPRTNDRVSQTFAAHSGDDAIILPQQSASEDFSDLPRAFAVPSTYRGIGGIDPRFIARQSRRAAWPTTSRSTIRNDLRRCCSRP